MHTAMSVRVVLYLNKLLEVIIHASSVDTPKARLDVERQSLFTSSLSTNHMNCHACSYSWSAIVVHKARKLIV